MMIAHPYTVRPGDTLSGLAASHGTSWRRLWLLNRRQIADPNQIYPGQEIALGPPQAAPQQPQSEPPAQSPAAVPAVVPGGFQACVISRESGGNAQVMNASDHYGLYQFSRETWIEAGGNPADFGRASAAEQGRVFASAYAMWGVSPWAAYDGC
jgi:LysM repeat protein